MIKLKVDAETVCLPFILTVMSNKGDILRIITSHLISANEKIFLAFLAGEQQTGSSERIVWTAKKNFILQAGMSKRFSAARVPMA